MVNIISDYIPPFSPLPNIAPFTYKDGETYLSTLENLRTYVNVTLVNFINTNFTALGNDIIVDINTLITTVNTALTNQTALVNTDIQNLTTYVNAQVAIIVANGIVSNDPVVTAIINNTASNTRLALDTIYKTPITALQAFQNSNTYVKTATTTDKIVYVSKGSNANDTNSGLNIGSPFSTINAAATALNGAGIIFIGAGTFTVTTAIALKTGMKLKGVSRYATNINVTTGSFAALTAGDLAYINFEDLTLTGSSDHIINMSGAGGLVHSLFKNCYFGTNNPSSSVFKLRGSGSFQENTFDNCIMDRLAASTVPTIDIIDTVGAANANRFSRITLHSQNCTTTPAIRIEAATDGTYAYENQFVSVVGEQNPAGLVHLYGSRGALFENTSDYDSAQYVNDVLKVAKSATSTTLSANTVVINSGRVGSTLAAGVYDFNGTNSVNTTVINAGSNSRTPALNGVDIIIDTRGITLKGDNATLNINSSGTSSIQPTYGSSDGLLLAEGVAGYGASLLAFKSFAAAQNNASISAKGTIRWGDGTNAFDTIIKRSAAGIIQAGQKLTAIAGLGAGNSLAATTLGAVTKKMEIFDADGASLGFVPIYNSIT